MSARLVLLVAVAVVAAAGCGSEVSGDGDDAGDGPRIVRVEEQVDYYGACGNEILTLGDETFYPLLPEERQGFGPSYPVPDDESTALGSLRSAIRVMPPGPGDDTGTLVIYSDGIARFESDSGNITWLTDEERTYDWVC